MWLVYAHRMSRRICSYVEILVTKHGIPENLYSDKHTILISPIDGNLTQFGQMCEDLGINMIAANTIKHITKSK